jgi:tetratricopeptide (TPR) repeat protein
MHRRLIAYAAAALVCARFVGAQSPFQELSFAEARDTATKDGKALFVDFCTTWSASCTKLDARTWKDERIHRWLGERTIAIRVDAEKAFLLARRYGVREYPTLLFLNSGGLELGRLSGFVEPEVFLAAGEELLGAANPHKLARRAQEALPNDPIARMNLALSLALQGRYTEALEQYVWCYEQGVANDEDFAGVRETVLLDEIQRLGATYPAVSPAISDLARRIAAQVLEGTADERDLRDYVVLCTRLALRDEMLELFDRLKEKGEFALSFRKLLAAELTDVLIERRRYLDVYANTPDMPQDLARQITRYTNLRSQHGRSRTPGLGVDQAVLEQVRAQTLETGGRYFEVSLGVGQLSVANRIADRVLTFAPEAQSYEMLVRHALRAGASDAARAVAKRAEATPTLSAVEKSRIRRASMAPPSAH